MCNAKPGTRCSGPDTQKPIVVNAKKLDDLKKEWDKETDPGQRAILGDLLIEQNGKFKESKVAYYASAIAQKDFPAALERVKELAGERRVTHDDVENTLFLAGGNLYELQTTADNMRKNGDSQIEVARYFNQGGIMFETEKIRARITREWYDTPRRIGDTFDVHVRKLKALQIATGIMWRECAGVVEADMGKNSRVYISDDAKSRLIISKRATGRFVITNEFIVNADSPAEASRKAEKAFDTENVDISVEPVVGKKGEYRIAANYIYKSGENLTDALIYQNQVYRGHNDDFSSPENSINSSLSFS